MKKYIRCEPSQGVDGRHYVAADYVGEFSASHLDYERSKGNLREVEYIRDAPTIEDVDEGDLVCFGGRVPSVWREVV